jgi:hypothetical protein
MYIYRNVSTWVYCSIKGLEGKTMCFLILPSGMGPVEIVGFYICRYDTSHTEHACLLLAPYDAVKAFLRPSFPQLFKKSTSYPHCAKLQRERLVSLV